MGSKLEWKEHKLSEEAEIRARKKKTKTNPNFKIVGAKTVQFTRISEACKQRCKKKKD